jgi:hypothetical protein
MFQEFGYGSGDDFCWAVVPVNKVQKLLSTCSTKMQTRRQKFVFCHFEPCAFVTESVRGRRGERQRERERERRLE